MLKQSNILLISMCVNDNFSAQRLTFTWFCFPDEFWILLEFDIVIILVLHEHYLQIDIVTNLKFFHTSICLLIQSYRCGCIPGGQTPMHMLDFKLTDNINRPCLVAFTDAGKLVWDPQ